MPTQSGPHMSVSESFKNTYWNVQGCSAFHTLDSVPWFFLVDSRSRMFLHTVHSSGLFQRLRAPEGSSPDSNLQPPKGHLPFYGYFFTSGMLYIYMYMNCLFLRKLNVFLLKKHFKTSLHNLTTWLIFLHDKCH